MVRGWAKLKRIDGAKVVLSFRDEELELDEPTQWWKVHLDRIDQCLKAGQIMAYVDSDHIDRLVLQNAAGSRTTIYRPWRLW